MVKRHWGRVGFGSRCIRQSPREPGRARIRFGDDVVARVGEELLVRCRQLLPVAELEALDALVEDLGVEIDAFVTPGSSALEVCLL